MSVSPTVNRLERLDPELETILGSFDTEAFEKLEIIEFEDFDPAEQDRKRGLSD